MTFFATWQWTMTFGLSWWRIHYGTVGLEHKLLSTAIMSHEFQIVKRKKMRLSRRKMIGDKGRGVMGVWFAAQLTWLRGKHGDDVGRGDHCSWNMASSDPRTQKHCYYIPPILGKRECMEELGMTSQFNSVRLNRDGGYFWGDGKENWDM